MAQPNPPPTLVLSDHEPVLLSGVGEGWERLPLRERLRTCHKDAGGVSPQP